MSAARPVGFFATAILIAFTATRLGASDAQPDPRGRPKQFDQGKAAIYALWYDEGAWHLRVTSGRRRRAGDLFTGTISIEGGRIAEGRFEGFERRKQSRNIDWIRMHRDNKGFDFHMAARGKVDALSFKVTDQAQTITFKLQVSGDDNPQRILIGSQGRRPEKIPFTLPAHPEKQQQAE